MQVQLPIFIISLLVHGGIFLTSGKSDCKLRLMAGLAVLFNTLPVWYVGEHLLGEENTVFDWLGLFMRAAPYYFPFLSFLVYIRRDKDSVWR